MDGETETQMLERKFSQNLEQSSSLVIFFFSYNKKLACDIVKFSSLKLDLTSCGNWRKQE